MDFWAIYAMLYLASMTTLGFTSYRHERLSPAVMALHIASFRHYVPSAPVPAPEHEPERDTVPLPNCHQDRRVDLDRTVLAFPQDAQYRQYLRDGSAEPRD